MRGKTGYCFVAQASISFWALPKSPRPRSIDPISDGNRTQPQVTNLYNGPQPGLFSPHALTGLATPSTVLLPTVTALTYSFAPVAYLCPSLHLPALAKPAAPFMVAKEGNAGVRLCAQRKGGLSNQREMSYASRDSCLLCGCADDAVPDGLCA